MPDQVRHVEKTVSMNYRVVIEKRVIASDRRERGNLVLDRILQELRSPRRFAPRDDDSANAL